MSRAGLARGAEVALADPVEALILDLLEWLDARPRPYAQVMDAWRTSCPRLPVWEDANDREFIERSHDERLGTVVSLTPLGRAFLDRCRPARRGFEIREATIADIPVLASHRASMFADMGTLRAVRHEPLIGATADYLRDAMPRGEYLGWLARSSSPSETIGGAGAQLRNILPRPDPAAEAIELGPEAIILNVYVVPPWRRRGVAEALVRAVLASLAQRKVRRIVLHASDDGRRLYERLGFVASNEMRLEGDGS